MTSSPARRKGVPPQENRGLRSPRGRESPTRFHEEPEEQRSQPGSGHRPARATPSCRKRSSPLTIGQEVFGNPREEPGCPDGQVAVAASQLYPDRSCYRWTPWGGGPRSPAISRAADLGSAPTAPVLDLREFDADLLRVATKVGRRAGGPDRRATNPWVGNTQSGRRGFAASRPQMSPRNLPGLAARGGRPGDDLDRRLLEMGRLPGVHPRR